MRPQRSAIAVFAAFAMIAVPAGRSAATPYEYLRVGSAIEQELRNLDVLGLGALEGRFRLPRLGTRPLQMIELQGTSSPVPDSLLDADPLRRFSMIRLERALGRDAADEFPPDPRYRSTPRLFQHKSDGQRLEVSTGFAGAVGGDEHDVDVADGTGWETAISLSLDRWLAFSRVTIGNFDSVFAEGIVKNGNLLLMTDESYIAYTDPRERWNVMFGLNRWHWGPGLEGSLMLSSTAPSMVGLSFRAHLDQLHMDAIALSATVRASAGEQLAAHRIEWQPLQNLRIGVTEAARYQSPGWQPLYVVGVIPYVLVQRIQVQAEPDSLDALRNNILTSADASWRIAEGTRIYGEILVDDLHAGSESNPNKYAFQLGWDGVGRFRRGRLTWNGEYTRVTGYVYTSYFGRDYSLQGDPLGFPVAPDSRRMKLQAAWDVRTDWQLLLQALYSDKGENDLSEPYVPGSGPVNTAVLQGNVENTRQAVGGIRFWPASGVDLTARFGWRWIDQPLHVKDAREEGPVGSFEFRIIR